MTRLCYPEWRPLVAGWISEYGKRTVARPGCTLILDPSAIVVINASGDCKAVRPDWGLFTCSPESLRAHAEGVLRELGLLDRYFEGRLTLDAYSLARNIASEQGRGTPEERVALAQSTMGRARLRGTSVTGVILNGKPTYGRIHGFFPGGKLPTSGTPESRCEITTRPGFFTSSSQSPTVADLLIAQFVLFGGAEDFARGADNQAALGLRRTPDDRANDRPAGGTWLLSKARERSYWIGDLPGVDAQALTLFRVDKDVSPDSAEGQRRIAAGLAMLRRVNGAPLVTCGPGAGTVAFKIVGALGGVALTGYLLSRLLKGTSATRLSRLLPEL